MPRTITDEEYNRLMGRAQIADLIEPVWDDPALGQDARALLKKKYPNLKITDYDMRNEFQSALAKDRADREEAERKRKEEEEDARIKGLRTKTKDQYGFTDEAMGELENLMVERNIGDYEVAATYMASKKPKSTTPTFDSTRWHHEKKDGFAEIAKDPEAWGRNELMNAVQRDMERASART